MNWFLSSPAFCLYCSYPNSSPSDLVLSKSNIFNPLHHFPELFIFPIFPHFLMSSTSLSSGWRKLSPHTYYKPLPFTNKKESKTEIKQNPLIFVLPFSYWLCLPTFLNFLRVSVGIPCVQFLTFNSLLKTNIKSMDPKYRNNS